MSNRNSLSTQAVGERTRFQYFNWLMLLITCGAPVAVVVVIEREMDMLLSIVPAGYSTVNHLLNILVQCLHKEYIHTLYECRGT